MKHEREHPEVWIDEETGLVFDSPPSSDPLLVFEFASRGEWVVVLHDGQALPVRRCPTAELAHALAEWANTVYGACQRAQAQFAAGGISGRP